MIATGLGGAAAQARSARRSSRCCTQSAIVERTGTDGVGVTVTETIDYDKLDQPAVVRRRAPSIGGGARRRSDAIDIPAFLRKQSD